jgi:plasmid stability protein
MPITWTNEKRKLSQLIPWERNPRQIKVDQADRLAESFDEFGQVETIAIGPRNEIYNGHQRLNVLAARHGKDYEVEVRVASRALTEKEREKLTVLLHKGAVGGWDFDSLANTFEFSDLIDWGFEEDELLGLDYKNPHLKESEESIPKPREMVRILVSVPVDLALEAKEHIDQLQAIDGVEVIYGAN